MPNTINQVVGALGYRGVDRLRGGAASIDISGAKVGLDPQFEEKQQELQRYGSAMDNLGKVFENWTQASQKKDQQTGEERANYLLNHYTPAELAQARKDGVMLYQDDPYAMQSLQIKQGQTVAQNIDSSLTEDIPKGTFTTREALDKERAKRLNEEGRKQAEAYGADWDSLDFQKGLNSQVTERNITLYGAHDQWLDGFHKKQAQLQHKTDNQSLYSSPDILRSGNAGDIIMGNLEKQRSEGGWTDTEAQNTLRSDFDDIAGREGGMQFLEANKDKMVNWNGKQVAIKSMFSEDEWQSMTLKAAQADFKLNAAKNEKFSLGLYGALNNPDMTLGQAQIDIIKNDYNRDHPGDLMTPERQMIIDTERQMIAKRAQQNAESAKQLQKSQNQQGNIKLLDDAWTRSINGEQVPTDASQIPGVDGKAISHDDAVAFADYKFRQIDGMDVPEDTKTALKMQYLSRDKADGAFRSRFTSTISIANSQWANMMSSGQDNGGHNELDQFQRLYNSNPAVVRAAFPDQGEMFARFDEMNHTGMKLQTILDASREVASIKNDFARQKEVNDNWTKMAGDSSGSSDGDLSSMDARTADTARTYYMAQLGLGKDYATAFKSAQAFVKGNMVEFSGSDTEGTSYGAVPKTSLMINGVADSVDRGQQLVNDAIAQIETQHPVVKGHLAVTTDTNGDILIRSPIEGYQYRMTPKMLADADAQNMQATHEAEVQAAKQHLQAPHYKDIYAHVGDDGDTIPDKIMHNLAHPGNGSKAAELLMGREVAQSAGKQYTRPHETAQERSKRHQREREAKKE